MASKSYDKIADICDKLILQVSIQGITFQDEWPYSIHLLGHIYINDINSARFLWKLIPSCVQLESRDSPSYSPIELTLLLTEYGERLQVLHYEVVQKYEPHYDYFLVEFNTKNGGQQIATLLMYLSDVDEWGETISINYSIVVEPTRPDYRNVIRKTPIDLRQIGENHLIVATLVAIVAFTAGFTMPGGYNGNNGPNQGMAILTREAAFKAFMVTDTIAMSLSISAVLIHFYATITNNQDMLESQVYTAAYLIVYVGLQWCWHSLQGHMLS
ncbi:Prolyl 4-hydroxylase 5 [Camellia lanceoleosa]|uniref:Prolyl 4-hydroxylase 5 n=1 Tax=Camellia lanceoleosa TaxID=1840588 RepID=A0ACC0I6L8_9ERIC|nr:Prolyl 4-hydroxylase 5 [Camellia lanceoleosa]